MNLCDTRCPHRNVAVTVNRKTRNENRDNGWLLLAP